MAWYSSWIPRFPTFSFAVPSNIQSRFISFVLKKTLGHFLKPGQLDHSQIDSQIGQGYVQVSDLDLCPEAIDLYLEGLPLTFTSGTISSVKARIPWPNPLASTVGFSVKGLHLVFTVSSDFAQPSVVIPDIAQSVASVAESFLHEELSPKEEAALWQSFHEDQPLPEVNQTVPGGLSGLSSSAEDAVRAVDGDPAGISMFASLIETLLARFEFDAEDILISLVHPENMSISFAVENILYQTDSTQGSDVATLPARRATRSLSISGARVLTENLNSFGPSIHDLIRSPSPASTNSSMDDETQFTMTQSLAQLPPRSPSPSDSMIGSMYHSAISVHSAAAVPVPQGTETPLSSSRYQETSLETEVLLVLGTKPVVLVLQTPVAVVVNEDPFVPLDADEFQLKTSINEVAFALRPWQINGLAQLASIFKDLSSSTSPNKPSPPNSGPSLRILFELGGLVGLLVPSNLTGENSAFFSTFFEHPWKPLPPSYGYLRLQIHSIAASFAISASDPELETPAPVPPSQSSFELHFTDFSVFCFNLSPSTEPEPALTPFPLLITDQHLLSQYDSRHIHPEGPDTYPTLPRFEIIDWAYPRPHELGIKLSKWRAQPKLATSENAAPALRLTWSQAASQLKVSLSPLHLRFDFGLVLQGSLLIFIDQLLELTNSANASHLATSDATIKDERIPNPNRNDQADDLAPPKLFFEIDFTFVRLSIACPSPSRFGCRSGQILVDLHQIMISNQPTGRRRGQVYFEPESEISPENAIMKVEFKRALVSVSAARRTRAIGLLSIGSLVDNSIASPFIDDTSRRGPDTPSLRTSILLSKAKATSPAISQRTVVSIQIPSVHVDAAKTEVDSMQYWVDDVSQFLETAFGSPSSNSEGTSSRDTSVIGSRFFAKSRSGSGVLPSSATQSNAETVVKVAVSEAFIRAMLPRTDSQSPQARPFDVKASDISVLLEVNPDNMKQTVITADIMNFSVDNYQTSKDKQTFLHLTASRSLSHLATPMLQIRFSTQAIAGMTTKETSVGVVLNGLTYNFCPNLEWINDLVIFAKNPPGTFEAVVPSDRTYIEVQINSCSLRVYAPSHSGALVLYSQALKFSTEVVGAVEDSEFNASASHIVLLAADNIADLSSSKEHVSYRDHTFWTAAGYALVLDVSDLDTQITIQPLKYPLRKVVIKNIRLGLHLCADTIASITAFSQDLTSLFKKTTTETQPAERAPPVVTHRKEGGILSSSIDDMAFRKIPDVGPPPDMINDDLPTNLDYLDASFGAAGGLRELVDEDLDEFDEEQFVSEPTVIDDVNVVSRVGGETIKVFDSKGLEAVEDYFINAPVDTTINRSELGDAEFSLRITDGDVTLHLYDGYDWVRTRKTIEEEVKEMRKRLAKIKQLVAAGQIQDTTSEDTSALLFNSVHIGLEQDDDDLAEPAALIAAIDEELRDDFETSSQSSWQSLRPTTSSKPQPRRTRLHGKKLTRSRQCSLEFRLSGLRTEFDQFLVDDPLVSRSFITVRDVEILDHIKTSTWKKFLTALRSDSHGNVRETDSNMARIELRSVRPALGHTTSEEARLRVKILPLRLYVDQDAVDFLKKFFSFKDSPSTPQSSPAPPGPEPYIQLAEFFPIDLKLDYKPRRVDYKALKEGRTIELMNFFHFDGAEMTLRHITLAGVTGWPRLFEMLNDLWTPDVKATQLVEVISGVAPIRSMVNVGSGVADLILLPISQYKKDGRVVRGVQKGATAFVKSTAIEAIKMGAKLAIGTQVILEQAEGVLGGQFEIPITAEPVQMSTIDEIEIEDYEARDHFSKYAQQPGDVKEGVQSAYNSLRKNLSSAAQTILAVPMEVYERSGNEGPVRAVIRAVPIAILKPMIGASEAVSKTLLGLHNTLDPNVRHDNEAKYKLR